MASKSDECVVKGVKLRNGQPGPVLVTFQHGCLKKDESWKLKCGVFTTNDDLSKRKVAAVADGGDVLYQGDLQDEDDLCRTFLAVRNKATNKMRIFETSQVMLSPSIVSNNVILSDIADDKKQANYTLSRAFGSKKAKRIADQRERMEVNVDSVKEKYSTAVSNIEVKSDNLVAAEDDSLTKLLPPCNREAAAPSDVYPVDGILRRKEIESLENYYSKSAEEIDLSHMSPFYQLMRKNVAAGNIRNSALLLYAESLLKFCNLHPKQISQKGTVLCPFSDLVHKRILKDFTTLQGATISRSQFLTDKAVMYIIILCLHVNGFQLDLNIIAECIRSVDINRIRMLARIIGTVPAKTASASKSLVILKVPLPAPQSLVVKGRKSRR